LCYAGAFFADFCDSVGAVLEGWPTSEVTVTVKHWRGSVGSA
jgi:hypothetical protein